MALVENVTRTVQYLEPSGSIEPGEQNRKNIDPALPGNARLIADRALLVIDATIAPPVPADSSAQRDRPVYAAAALPANVPAGAIFRQLGGDGRITGEFIVGADRSLTPISQLEAGGVQPVFDGNGELTQLLVES